eukprot:4552552-Prymnesium_polylepis.1
MHPASTQTPRAHNCVLCWCALTRSRLAVTLERTPDSCGMRGRCLPSAASWRAQSVTSYTHFLNFWRKSARPR